MDHQAFRGSRSGNQEAKGAQKAGEGEGNYFDKWGWKPLGPSGDRGPFYGSGYPLGLLGQAVLFLVVATVVYLVIPFGSDGHGPALKDDEKSFVGQEVGASADAANPTSVGTNASAEDGVQTPPHESYMDAVKRQATNEEVSQADHELWVRDFMLANHLLAKSFVSGKQSFDGELINVLRRLNSRKVNSQKQEVVIKALSDGFLSTRNSIINIEKKETSGLAGVMRKAWGGGEGVADSSHYLKQTGGVRFTIGMSKEQMAVALASSSKSNFRSQGEFYLASQMQVPVLK